MTVGRPKQFSNVAEKQKAYRERQKAQKNQPQEQDPVTIAVMEHLQKQLVTLRNLVSHWQSKGKSVEICGRMDYGVVLVDGYNQRTIFSADWVYLLVSGALIEKRKRAFETVYELKPISTNMNTDN